MNLYSVTHFLGRGNTNKPQIIIDDRASYHWEILVHYTRNAIPHMFMYKKVGRYKLSFSHVSIYTHIYIRIYIQPHNIFASTHNHTTYFMQNSGPRTNVPTSLTQVNWKPLKPMTPALQRQSFEH